jgi:nucleoside-diphosphate-sugar epimerase
LKILLTGANGFTGFHFAKAASAAGYIVHPLKSDITDAKSLEVEVLRASPDLVAHFAGISFVPSKDEEAFYRVHALGTSNLLNALLKLEARPNKVLLASSATIYGNSPSPFSQETQAPAPIDHYAMSKVAMEEMAKTYFDRLPIIIARPFNYTGIGQKDNFLVPKLIRHFSKKLSKIELGNLDVEREFNDVELICQSYMGLLNFGESGEIYNVCSGNARSLKQVVDCLIRITGHQIQIDVNPDFVRSNEVRRMCGDPKKIQTLFEQHHVRINAPSLEETLTRMLAGAKQ